TGDTKLDTVVNARLDDLGAVQSFNGSWTWSSLYGGGGTFVVADDGQDPAMPLSMAAIRSVKSLTTISKRRMQPGQWERDPLSPHFGKPSTYRFQRVGGGGGTDLREVHRSRMIMFP